MRLGAVPVALARGHEGRVATRVQPAANELRRQQLTLGLTLAVRVLQQAAVRQVVKLQAARVPEIGQANGGLRARGWYVEPVDVQVGRLIEQSLDRGAERVGLAQGAGVVDTVVGLGAGVGCDVGGRYASSGGGSGASSSVSNTTRIGQRRDRIIDGPPERDAITSAPSPPGLCFSLAPYSGNGGDRDGSQNRGGVQEGPARRTLGWFKDGLRVVRLYYPAPPGEPFDNLKIAPMILVVRNARPMERGRVGPAADGCPALRGSGRDAELPGQGGDNVDIDIQVLVEQAQQGDREAFGAIYEQLAPKIHLYLYHHTNGRAHLAEDLTEEVFVKVLEKLQSYQDRGLPFVSWVYRVAHNHLVDYFRDAAAVRRGVDRRVLRPQRESG